MSTRDDYFDVKDAYEKWERAYGKWGNAAYDETRTKDTPEGVKAEKKAQRAADRYLVACDYLARMAQKTRGAMLERGWKPTAVRKAPRRKRK